MKLYSGYYSGQDPFGIFASTTTVQEPKQMSKDGCLILWGGEDISPSIYGQLPVHTRADRRPSMRDMVEMNLAKYAIKKGIPIIGICRGAQLMCAVSGGTLYQHIEGTKHSHHSNHNIVTNDGRSFKTSSCHHQALNLEGTDGEVLAHDPVPVVAFTDTDKLSVTIPEVVYFKGSKTLAIQGHPEWMNPNTSFVQYCSEKIEELLFKEL